ncbi:multicopper oxidase domain-containing protein [uncultured Ornithinimicrobium sp.]|uniref:multicopper oxidase domain-containing protein n=1 Tax=uncultured Ornithinimicrobium sp. TaxID=259307 RepID=UPI002591879B|nr:multicopper oxidase domain-containing protein [uncultured Ornithinimicrobium sp.]
MSTARGTWFMRDRPVAIWLFVAFLVALVHPFFASSRWLVVHLVVLGVVTHSAMVWSVHFTDALLKTKAGFEERRWQTARLSIFQVGIILVFIGVPTNIWLLTLAGGTVISAAIVWHAIALGRRLRAALPGRFRITVRYYIVAALLLPVGATFGVLLARGLGDPWHGRLLVAHSMINLLGWVGLTVLGTLVTLWPTMLRTRMAPNAESTSKQALPVFILALVLVVVGPLVDLAAVAAAGIVAYLVGTLWVYRPIVAAARNRPPSSFPALSAGAGLFWLPIGLGLMAWSLLERGSWADLSDSYGILTTIFVVGFALQIVLGALSYLLPVAIGGGPHVLRLGMREMDRWGTARVVVANVGLALALLPVPSLVRVVLSVLVLVALGLSIPILLRGIYAGVKGRRAAAEQPPAPDGTPPQPVAPLATSWSRAELVTGLAITAVGATIGVGLDPTATRLTLASSKDQNPSAVTPTGHTTTVEVTAKDMRFHPAEVSAPLGDKLIIELKNTDTTNVHDIVLANGASSGRLSPGQRATVDVGVVSGDIDGWCSVVGHRQMGMVFAVKAIGGTGGTASVPASTSPRIDFMKKWGADFTGIDPVLPPLTDEKVHHVTLTVEDVKTEVAPEVFQTRWTYNGGSVAPVLHGRVGDTFVVKLVNNGTMAHSVDFHASEISPDVPMRDIAPGESLVYTFTAKRSGIWMYHCLTAPMTAHIAAGMAGAVIIDPPDLPKVDRSYVITQSELYLGAQSGPVDAAKAAANQADAMMFNGLVGQYVDRPLTAKVGERVRFWVLDIGPNRPLSFHIVGTQFDTVYKEGTHLLKNGRGPLDPPDYHSAGSQALGLLPAQGGFVETTFPAPGHYTILNHIAADAETGARGIITVTK